MKRKNSIGLSQPVHVPSLGSCTNT